MSLLGQRVELETDNTLTCSSVVAAADVGGFVCYNVAGSGIGQGDSAGSVQLAANPSGLVVAGNILHEVANIDETKFHRNWNKEQTLVGERCVVGRKGRWTTDKVTGSPTPGQTAYLTTNGVVTPTLSATGGLVATPKVGQFKTSKDQSGYVTVEINLPVV
jgi:hypothetical protein